ncbi:hypothetical protein PCANC_11320 [Puccinia coronata f. sp. avenae]|uniref:Uncharacterized protein n=1 Tax=Puccinia coronata f. sp. avenae TaxID=200324 RepID=A0A2N5RZ57_9BASI|nr:hypothetical protein PCASD_26817 [Puccinia coronata f. sp. avenae]PLW37216.1 hypothetical protein PCASD_15355 [Puccinia coronata f. sp. avenae]PLW53150.1 hypothetical protein PCANC_11320 [Puccinia coronata f. sp. avenae]
MPRTRKRTTSTQLSNAMPCTRKRTTSTQDRTPEDKTNPNSSQAASGIVPTKRLTDKEELKRAQKIAENAVSSSYQSYHTPKISSQKDKYGRIMSHQRGTDLRTVR